MSEVYTPGTAISSDLVVRKMRRLMLDGEVLVRQGQHVEHDTIVAKAMRPGKLATLRVAQQLSIEPDSLEKVAIVRVGDTVAANQVVAEHKTFFGWLTWRCKTSVAGTVEFLSKVSGHIGIRQPSEPVEVSAYLPGEVVEVIPGRGAVVESRCAMVQGLFGIGGERTGVLKILKDAASPPWGELSGTIVVMNAAPTAEWLRKAAAAGVQGVACPTMDDSELSNLLGYEIGVAITGDEACGITVLLLEGFGRMGVAPRTWKLLESLQGRRALISGATQVRAGVIRPEVLIPYDRGSEPPASQPKAEGVVESDSPRVRALRAPYFGLTGRIIKSPVEPQVIASGARMRVFTVRLDDGREVTIARANVEVLE